MVFSVCRISPKECRRKGGDQEVLGANTIKPFFSYAEMTISQNELGVLGKLFELSLNAETMVACKN
jgi:hypothetical protein